MGLVACCPAADIMKRVFMKKQLLALLAILLLTGNVLFAQDGRNLARIHAAKMAYLTDRLHITPDQSAGFMPVYNQYEKEIADTRQSFLGKYKETNPRKADDATSRQFVDDNLDYQQAVIAIKRKYNERFLKVLSPQQLTDLYPAEREFRQILMQRLKQRHIGRFGR